MREAKHRVIKGAYGGHRRATRPIQQLLERGGILRKYITCTNNSQSSPSPGAASKDLENVRLAGVAKVNRMLALE